ncbi:MAG: neutral zinc metallopeptidase [Acidobacteriota bacterium]
MRWRRGHKSADVIDRRAQGGRRRMPGGRKGGLGLGGLLILFLVSVVFKQDFFSLLNAAGGTAAIGGGASAPASSGPLATSPQEEERFQFISFVLDDVQNTWERLFPTMGHRYQRAKMVVFRDSTPTACGYGESASGPFYCPGDQQVYIDLSFFDQLHHRFGAPGDFAQAYVIAHEIGHHIQTVLGIERQVRQAQRQDRRRSNQLSVLMELQADCLAGVWAHSTVQRDLLERGDIEESLAAAAAVGDDSIQRQTTGRVNPETFTHGTAAQRTKWFKRGLQTGDPNDCDTFSG